MIFRQHISKLVAFALCYVVLVILAGCGETAFKATFYLLLLAFMATGGYLLGRGYKEWM